MHTTNYVCSYVGEWKICGTMTQESQVLNILMLKVIQRKLTMTQCQQNKVYKYLYVLLKALPPVCMKYTAGDESQVANIAQGEVFVTRLSSRAVYFIQTKWLCFKCFIVFYNY